MKTALSFTVISLLLLPGFLAAQVGLAPLPKVHLPLDNDRNLNPIDGLAAGDVDGDGDVDLVFSTLGRQNRLQLNDGTGIFTDVSASNLPPDTDLSTAVALGDLDKDGDLDLVVGNFGQSKILFNNGKGVFTWAAAALPAGFLPTLGVALADVDGDGDLDLLLATMACPNSLFQNDGKGNFTDVTATQMPCLWVETMGIYPGDVDGDSDLDLVIANTDGQNHLFLNDGKGFFADDTAARLPLHRDDETNDIVLGDLDGDGDLDMVCANGEGQNRLYLNDGKGFFADATASLLPQEEDDSCAFVLGDVDGDGDLDLIVGNWEVEDPLYLNDGKGKFTLAPKQPLYRNDGNCALILADLDGDGDLDLVSANEKTPNRLCFNDGKGGFVDGTVPRLPSDMGGNDLVVGDLDGDGAPDLVLGWWPTNRIHLNDGKGGFTDGTAGRMPRISAPAEAIALGDVDGDGDLDLVCGLGYGTSDRLLLNDGTGAFVDGGSSRIPWAGNWTEAVALGDVDGDGDLDLVIGYLGQPVPLLLNDGKGYFSLKGNLSPLAGETYDVVLGDVDGDGDLDILVANRGQQDRLFLNDGKGGFTDATTSHLPALAEKSNALALGDVDRDGDLDLVVVAGGPNRIYLNDGKGKFSDATAARMPADREETTALVLGDIDLDGDLDIVISDIDRGVRLIQNDGTGRFTDISGSGFKSFEDAHNALRLADVDGDGDLDLVAAGEDEQPTNVYENLVRQLGAPYLARIGKRYKVDSYARPGFPATANVAFPFLGYGQMKITGLPYGTWWITPVPLVTLGAQTIPPGSGMATCSVQLPLSPALAGTRIFVQALMVHSLPGSAGYLMRFTNVLEETVYSL